MSESSSQDGSRSHPDNLTQPEIQTYTFNPLHQGWQYPTATLYTPGTVTSYPWKRAESNQSGMEGPSQSPTRHMSAVLNDFCIGMIELLQLQQSRGITWQSPRQQCHNCALGLTCMPSENQIRICSPKAFPAARKRRGKLTSPLRFYGAGGKAKRTIKRHMGKILLHLVQQTKEQGTHESVLQSIACKYPQYRGIVSVIPFVVEHMPQRLQEQLAKRARSNTGRIALMLFRRWALK